MREREAETETQFYQRFPLRLIIGFLLTPFFFIIYVVAANIDVQSPELLQLANVVAAFSVLCLVVGIANTIVIIYRPALVLTMSRLRYRGFDVPWSEMDDIVRYRTKDGSGIGLVVSPSFAEEQVPGLRNRAMRAIIRRRGVLPIPPLKGISVDELVSMLTRRRSVDAQTTGVERA